ncbi:biotin/lipoyl-binding protein, partial [Gracilibacillus oryzae]
MKEIKVPELAESITEGTIAEWLVSEGDSVEKGDPICELETDKVNVEVNADYTGVVAELVREAGDDVEVGEVIAKIDENGEAGSSKKEESPAAEEKEKKEEAPKPDAKKEEKSETPEPKTAGKEQKVVASPAARKRARELGIDLNQVVPSDPLGRIRPEDVDNLSNALKNEQKASKSDKKEQKSSSSAAQQEYDKPVEREKMSRRRQTIANRLVEAQHTAAMLTT